MVKRKAEPESIAKRLAAHCNVARVLSESRTLSEATPKILREISEALGWSAGIIFSKFI